MPGPLESLSALSLSLNESYHALAGARDRVTVSKDGSAFTMEQEINFLARFIYERFRHSVNAASEPALAEDYFNKLLERVEETGQVLYQLYLTAGGDDAKWGITPPKENDLRLPVYQAVHEEAESYDDALREAEATVQALFWEMFPIYERLHGKHGEGSSHELVSTFVKLYGAWKGCGKALESFPHHHYHYDDFIEFVNTLEMAPPIMDDIGLWPENDLPADSPRLSAVIHALKHWENRDWFKEEPPLRGAAAER